MTSSRSNDGSAIKKIFYPWLLWMYISKRKGHSTIEMWTDGKKNTKLLSVTTDVYYEHKYAHPHSELEAHLTNTRPGQPMRTRCVEIKKKKAMPALINLNIYQSSFLIVWMFALFVYKKYLLHGRTRCWDQADDIRMKKCNEKHFHATTDQIAFFFLHINYHYYLLFFFFWHLEVI